MAHPRLSRADARTSDAHAASGDTHVSVPTPGGDVVLVDPRVHRADVVRRLLEMGVAPRTLTTLLPGWGPLVRAVVADAPAPQPSPGV